MLKVLQQLFLLQDFILGFVQLNPAGTNAGYLPPSTGGHGYYFKKSRPCSPKFTLTCVHQVSSSGLTGGGGDIASQDYIFKLDYSVFYQLINLNPFNRLKQKQSFHKSSSKIVLFPYSGMATHAPHRVLLPDSAKPSAGPQPASVAHQLVLVSVYSKEIQKIKVT